MLTFDGKSASFVPGKEVTNKEPAISKFVVEKLYQVHRERINKMEPVIVSRIEIPDFLTNTSWKKQGELHRQEVIRKENEVIYQRIAKVENLESSITRASREHKKRVETELVLMKNLKLKGRIRDFLKVQRENEDMLKRIEKARPEYTLKGCREWYKHHELFKQGRRSDPCGGHLGFRVPKKLMPKKIPPVLNSSLDCALNSVVFSKENKTSGVPVDPRSSRGNTPGGRRISESINAKNNKLARGVLTSRARTAGGSVSGADFMDQHSMFDLQETLNMTSQASSTDETDSLYREMLHIGKNSANAQRPSTTNDSTSKTRSRLLKTRGAAASDSASLLKRGTSLQEATEDIAEGSVQSHADGSQVEDKESSLGYGSNDFDPTESQASLTSGASAWKHLKKQGYHVLLSRPYTIPFAHTCVVQLLSRASGFSDDLCIRVLQVSANGEDQLAERYVPIDTVFDVVNSTTSSSLLKSGNNDDLQSLRSLLITMFKEADDDGNGYLTYDEFETLMDSVELGITHQELRHVITEADENENGVVEFDEFVPLAVDLIQSFRSVNRAKIYCSSRDALYEEEVHQKMLSINIEDICNICMSKIAECDPKKYGVMRIQEFRRCLNSIAYAADLNESEISRVIYMLPVDPFGRVLYNGLPDVLSKVKFHALKSEVLRSQGSDLQRQLFEKCTQEEIRLSNGQNEGAVGHIPADALVDVLKACGKNLSRLQICVLLAGCVVDGEVDYHQFIPVAAKAIDFMFEPKALRQRAELIERTDLSSENLINALNVSVEELTQKVSGLFHSCDVNHSGSLNLGEFVLVLKSLEFELNDEEIEAYFFMIPRSKDNDEVTLDEIVQFLKENLPILQRKKQNRKLAAQLHKNHQNDNIGLKEHAKELETKLKSIFELTDQENTGFLTNAELKSLLQGLQLGISPIELDLILAEADRQDGDEDGLVDYMLFLPDCVELLKTFIAKEDAKGKAASDERKAYEKAESITLANRAEITQIASYLRSRLSIIDQQLLFESEKFKAASELVHNPHSGLTKTEGNAMLTYLFENADDQSKGEGSPSRDSPITVGPKRDDKVESPQEKEKEEDAFKYMAAAPSVRKGVDEDAYAISGPNVNARTGSGSEHTLKSFKSVGYSVHASSKTAKRALKQSLKKVTKKQPTTLKKSLNELVEIVHSIRRNSIMRGILDDLSPSVTTNLILALIEQIREDMIKAHLLDPKSIYVPVKVCYQALYAPELRLNRSQILSIVSWAECYDKTGTLLDYKRFAEHSAKVIMKLFDEDHLTNRAQVLRKSDDADPSSGDSVSAVMNGLTRDDLVFFLKQTFESILSINSRELTQVQCIHALMEIPLVKLTEQEAASATAACTKENLGVDADEMMLHAYDILSSICRERFVNRRVAMYALSSEGKNNSPEIQGTDSFNEMIDIAERFIDFLKIRQVQNDGGANEYHIVLSTDKTSVVNDSIEDTSDALEASTENNMNAPEVVLVENRTVCLPVVEKPKAVDPNMQNMGRAALAAAQAKAKREVVVLPSTFDGTIKIVAVETRLAMDREMCITVTTKSGQVAVSEPGGIKLPMLCAIEKELAQEFAQSLLSRLCVQMKNSDDPSPIIRVTDGKVGGDEDVNFGHFFEYN